jgi:hypothetical protein
MAHENDAAKTGPVDLVHNAFRTLANRQCAKVPWNAASAWQIDG